MNKLDKSESEPQEPEEGQMMKVGPEELTTEEEWCRKTALPAAGPEVRGPRASDRPQP